MAAPLAERLARRLPHDGWVVLQKSAFDQRYYIVHEGTKERVQVPDNAVGNVEISYFDDGDAFVYDDADGNWHVADLLAQDWFLAQSS